MADHYKSVNQGPSLTLSEPNADKSNYSNESKKNETTISVKLEKSQE